MLRSLRVAAVSRGWLALALLTLPPVVLLMTFILTRPQQVSDALLRAGGGIVTGVTDRPARTAAVSAVVLLLVWGGIGLRCLFECARDSAESTATNRQITSNGIRSPVRIENR